VFRLFRGERASVMQLIRSSSEALTGDKESEIGQFTTAS